MVSYVTPKKNTAFIFYISLEATAGGSFVAAPTIASGDFKVSIDGGATANLTTLPTNTPASSGMVKISLSSTEMNGDNITVICADAAGAEWLPVTINIQTSARQIDDLAYPATSGRSIVVDAAGLVDANMVKAGPTGAGTAITARDIGASVLLSSGTGTGQLDFTSGVVKANVTQFGGSNGTFASGRPEVNTTHADGTAWNSGAITRATYAAETGQQTIRSNTAQAGAAGSITLDASASATTDFYENCLIYLTGGTGVGQTRLCSAYNGTTKVATITPNWDVTPNSTSTFAVLPLGQVDLEMIGGAALSTTTAQLGVNVVQAAGTAWGSGAITAASIGANAITAAKVAADAIGASQLATDAVTEITNAVWANATRTVSAATNITSTGGTVPITAGGLVSADVTAISTDTAAADNLELAYDGTGYAGGTIKQNVNVSTISTDAIDAASIKADAVTEIQSGLATSAAVAALPTANANADALLDRVDGIETGITLRQALRLKLAALAGKLSGAATTTIAIRDANDTKDRITATVDADGNRTAVTLDAS